MTPPRILLVDDQRQVSRVLRSSLELSGREYLISEVASAEEALAEIDRNPIDLLVTDLRLPAMSGLQLVERATARQPRLKAMLITGNPTDEVRQRADVLGVVAFLSKPIGTNYFLEIVEAALEVAQEEEAQGAVDRRQALSSRLKELRQEVGAEGVYLIDGRAEIVAHSGEVADLELDGILGPIMTAHRASLSVNQALGTGVPANFHHLDGADHDVYLTNIGEHHALLIVHRGRQETGQLGSVMHFGRRTAEFLLLHLEEEPSAEGEMEKGHSGTQWEEVVAEDEKKDLKPEELEAAAQDVDEGGAEDFWEKASERSMKPEADEGSLTYEQAQELGLLEEE